MTYGVHQQSNLLDSIYQYYQEYLEHTPQMGYYLLPQVLVY
ncbi:hypothetical protein [Bacteroides faecis]|nr:hypothetical protein [Bacteroides faecis]MCS2551309.1 hypothetical protein [Bacteroides faecis]